ncbi:O-antigen ligase family protein [Lacibacter sediminis]|uniref:O-antigen ligase family protein n=1 Tax=Lacibacter sediminis TaxID=2760713 RepID=A0A7G5XFW0_9BACT|nr:O-antigen ligase family protein [Lacibacter sediminis]QNA44363.1 O-antigen ligase family protein [Lacibacter sediminis]
MATNRSTIHFYLFCTGILLMMVGFLLSRALLSIGMIMVIANGFLQSDLKERVEVFKKDYLLLGISCLFLLPFISGLWSNDQSAWLEMMQDMLPLLLLPFAMTIQKGFERKHFLFFALIWVSLLFAGSVWSAAHYVSDQENYQALYRISKTLPTPAENDHIRFSMAIVIALLLWLKLEEWESSFSRLIKWCCRVAAAWFVIYLHVLGAKTGLMGLYIVVLPLFIWQLYHTKRKQLATAALVAVFCLPVVSYYSIPTFRIRLQYVLFEQNNWQDKQFAGNFSDVNRLASIRSGWHVFQNNWLTGVGYGDIKEEAVKWYAANASEIPSSQQFLPLNQWMLSGSGAGIAAVLLFTLVVLLPFFKEHWQQNKQALAFVLFMDLVFFYESTINDQFGVFLYCFFILYWNLSIRPVKQ